MQREPTVHLTPKAARRRDEWWRGAVIYQVYPRSFADSNGDGVGDLPGIAARLEHLARLGVDAVWISPFFKSPQKDYGYDVADYCDVDPLFGTLEDFDRLLARAHELGLKVLIDFVPSHTSSEHPWFVESRQSRNNPKADWYVWHDANPDGTAPNNWLAVFGGISWEWESCRSQYYLHNFLKEQPQLNLWNTEVVNALLGAARFWLDRGVDGFRLDAVDWAVHDKRLRNNPPRRGAGQADGTAPGTPYRMQLQFYNKARPELVEFLLKPMHALTERYAAKALLGEISGDDALLRAAEYTEGGGLDMVYTFDLLYCPPTPAGVRGVVEALEKVLGKGWTCWSFSNHDVPRSASRFTSARHPDAARQLVPVLLGSLRGSICLYQGEELGLEQAELAFEDIRDPFGLPFWPVFKGRDGCRTPMPWDHAAPHAGFSQAKPWLPVYASHVEQAVDRQQADPESVLATTSRFLSWRREQPALRLGDIRFEDACGTVLAFRRRHDGASLLCCFNLGDEAATFCTNEFLHDAGFSSPGAMVEGDAVRLPPWGYAFATMD